jgi:hypothetical protein
MARPRSDCTWICLHPATFTAAPFLPRHRQRSAPARGQHAPLPEGPLGTRCVACCPPSVHATARKGLRVHAHLEECHFLARAHTVYARTLSLYPDTAGVRSLSCVAAGYTAGQYDRCAERVFERQVVARLSCAQLRLIVCVCVCVCACVRACLRARARTMAFACRGRQWNGKPVVDTMVRKRASASWAPMC